MKTPPQRGKSTPEETITLEMPAIKLKIPIKGLTLEGIEDITFDTFQEISRQAMAKVFEQYDQILMKERLRGVFKNLGKKGKWLQTRVGSIWYSRRLYKEKTTGKTRYFLDEELKMGKKQRISLKLAQVFSTLAAMEPYRAVADQISKLMGLTYSHEAIRQNVIKEAMVRPLVLEF